MILWFRIGVKARLKYLCRHSVMPVSRSYIALALPRSGQTTYQKSPLKLNEENAGMALLFTWRRILFIRLSNRDISVLPTHGSIKRLGNVLRYKACKHR